MDNMNKEAEDELKAAIAQAYNSGAQDAQQVIVDSIKQVAELFSRANMKTEWRIYTEMAKSIESVRFVNDSFL